MRFSLALTYVPIAVTALAYPGPAPTQAGHVDLAINGRSPVPTALASRSDPNNLFRRQSDSSRTCGYYDTDYQTAATCNDGYYCAYNSPDKVFGCCSGSLDDCRIETACYPSLAAALSCTDSSCQSNPYNLLCTEGSYTYCNAVISTASGTALTNFGCDTATSDTSTLYGSIDVPVVTYIQTAILTVTVQPSEPPLLRESSSSSSSSTSTSPLHTPSAPPIQISSPKPKIPIAPIIGGVVGGLAVIIIAIIAAIILIRKKRSSPPPTAPGAAEYVQQPPVQTYNQSYVQQPLAQTYDQSYTKQPIQSTVTPQTPYSPPMSPAPPYGTVHAYHAPAPLPHGIAEAP